MVLDDLMNDFRKPIHLNKHILQFLMRKWQAYKKLSLVYHPDKTAGMGAEQKEEPLGSEQIWGYG